MIPMAAQKVITTSLKTYELPPLPYAPDALEPHISKQQLSLHHDKHHQAYVTGANANLENLEKARQEGTDVDMKALLKELSFNIGGHLLHTLFWPTMAPAGKGGGGTPGGALADLIDREWGSFDRFKTEFSKAAASVEGSGWAALAYCTMTDRPMIMQIEKHNNNVYPMFPILMVLDVWEHAYYVDYKNNRGQFIDAFWNVVDWDEVNRRLEEI
ncbi:MAG TPA: superoxide dismutase [Candidatus Methanoculleus thermohydrogenotrophicum]|jgi:Fe-Mn family superoxide dismutase|nr:superoxide dismutase [Candidatus Methanoculleus thermohydrogenotrophicum]NLM81231.1 superoxide dismutase [Candidatus Methanoculleus thermohydrogenotrophicum]HOB17338.1 superoxide dismutase [Candidatus Methanoculleus thermohydrogenotrophicum]HPZ37493.1 superoxide dismutase [Candidatus Methanoculleus thermohydrogenotrophicum]HQC90945.1 superoxide dismutase [Candidatus Methanoculleus thermohydrogenotrophicum]